MPGNSINVYKRPNEPGIIPKFSMILLFRLICLCKKIKAGEGSVRMLFRTWRWHVPSRNHEPSWGKLWFARSLYQSLSQFGQKIKKWSEKHETLLDVMSCHQDGVVKNWPIWQKFGISFLQTGASLKKARGSEREHVTFVCETIYAAPLIFFTEAT